MAANYTYIKVSPESLYSCYTKIEFKICFDCSPPTYYKIKFLKQYPLIDIEVKGKKGISYQRTSEENGTTVSISVTDDETEIVANALVNGAVDDSVIDKKGRGIGGDLLYPLVSAALNLQFEIDFCKETRVELCLPENTHGYVHFSWISIAGLQYSFNKRNMDHKIRGFRSSIILYQCSRNMESSSQDQTEIKINSYYRPTFLYFFASLMTPPLIILPVILLLPFSSDSLTNRMLVTLTISGLTAAWYKTISTGMQRLISLINFIYLSWGFIGIIYYVFLHEFPYLLEYFLIGYVILILFSLYTLYGFYRHPTQIKEPFIVHIYRYIGPLEGRIGMWFDKLILREGYK